MTVQNSIFYAEPYGHTGFTNIGSYFGVFTHRAIPSSNRLLQLEICQRHVGLQFSNQQTANVYKNIIQFYHCPIETELECADSKKYAVILPLSHESYQSIERLIRHIQEYNTFEDARSSELFTRAVEASHIFNRTTYAHPRTRPQNGCSIL